MAVLCLSADGRAVGVNESRRGSSSEAAFAQAVAARARLEAVPVAARTRAQYEAVLNEFRAVYHEWPTAGKAPAAVEAVGELLAEAGRERGVGRERGAGSENKVGREHDLEAARGEFAFLVKQYPASPEVAEALLNAGELCANDLHDAGCARENLTAVLRRFPDSSYAEQAALDLKPWSANHSTHRETADAGNAGASKPGTTRAATQAAMADSSTTRMAAAVATKPTDAATPAPERVSSRGAATAATVVASADAPVEGVRGGARGAQVAEITGIRHWSNPVSTRIAIDLSREVEYEAARVSHPDRIFFDLKGARLARGLSGREVEVIDDGYLKRIRAAQYRPDVTRVVLDVTDVSDYSAFLLPNPWRLILDIHGGRAAQTASQAATRQAAQTKGATQQAAQATEATQQAVSQATMSATKTAAAVTAALKTGREAAVKSARKANAGQMSTAADLAGRTAASTPVASTPAAMAQAAQPTSTGERSLVRALGLKVNRIVIDAGHGGHDSGTLGPGGIEEKDVVLDVALRTGRLLEKRIGAKVIYTRDDDTFVPLETRTAMANKAQADLFLSIHANSSPEPEARGVETYYLNFTSDPQALELAARENAVSDAGVHQLSDLVRKIALKDKIEESREFAADVDESLYHGLSDGAVEFKDRGVKKAPFVVLIGAQMPSVLAEISFLTNPEDARLLRQAAWRERIAESLAAGVERYLSGLSSTKPMMEAGGEAVQSEADAADERR